VKQIFQNLHNGQTTLVEVPCPQVAPGHVLIQTRASLLSNGTERMLIDFGKSGFISKARQQPDKVRQVMDRVRTDGLLPVYDAVRAKLDQPLPLGYCNAGIVVSVGAGVTELRAGDRVVSNGAHAEIVHVPRNLCAIIPPAVDDESAAFAVLGAVALQGIRLAAPALGETVAVLGLGLVGLLTVQLLLAGGCQVLGADFDAERLALARHFGARTVDLAQGVDPVAEGLEFSAGRGLDAVLITAATRSRAPIQQAARMSRKRGRIVLIGTAGLELSRADFYEKELTFQVSCSYGPGRYDPDYERSGHDYPVGFVRWTAQRNFQAVLEVMAQGRLKVDRLISHRFALHQAQQAYELIAGGGSALGVVIRYPADEAQTTPLLSTLESRREAPARGNGPAVAFIGAGNFATRTLMPGFREAHARLYAVASSSGIGAAHAARKFGFARVTSDNDALLADPAIDIVAIATRHGSHAELVCRALAAGKHVFVEKPLAVSAQQLAQVAAALKDAAGTLTVGFNRRFAPQVRRMRELIAGKRQPKAILMTINAGALAADHWTRDPDEGGGRIIGEACHFVDLARYLVGAPIIGAHAQPLREGAAASDDQAVMTLRFSDHSVAAINYLVNGHASFPKERIEVFCGGQVLVLDNFRRLRGYGWPNFRKLNRWRQDKGHRAEIAAFLAAVCAGKPAPIPLAELLEVTRVTLDLARMVRA
jgi:predicted dehydrogenase/threonine dehydrogenase-like Zn-dependent dehydrogenase